jgi:hypothetical protein
MPLAAVGDNYKKTTILFSFVTLQATDSHGLGCILYNVFR